MISFKQFITEAFDSSYDVKRSNTGTTYRADFTDENQVIYRTSLNYDSGHVIVDFMAIKDGVADVMVTGGAANSLKVYSTIIKEIIRVVKQHPKTKIVYFSSADPRTVRLYGKLAEMIRKRLGGKSVYKEGWDFKIIL